MSSNTELQPNPYYHYRMAYESSKKNKNSEVKSELRRVQTNLFKLLKKKNFYPPLAQEALTDWNLNDIYRLSKKIYQNVGGWSGFKEEVWNKYPESFMYFLVDPFTLWIWATYKEKYNHKEYESIIVRARYRVYETIRTLEVNETELKATLKFYFGCVSDGKHLFLLSRGFHRYFKEEISWAENEYSFMDLVKGRIYRLIRDGIVEKIEPRTTLECVICMENTNEFRFHPNGYRHHTICGNCLESLPKLECPFCKIELVGNILK